MDPAGKPIEEKSHLRDLGVQVGNDCTFSTHIENTVAAGTKLAGWALRSFRRRSKQLMLTIWKSMVQPKLDYCSVLWSPSDQASIARLESVARHFTSKVAGLEELDYWDRLTSLQMYSQERRTERYSQSCKNMPMVPQAQFLVPTWFLKICGKFCQNTL